MSKNKHHNSSRFTYNPTMFPICVYRHTEILKSYKISFFGYLFYKHKTTIQKSKEEGIVYCMILLFDILGIKHA